MPSTEERDDSGSFTQALALVPRLYPSYIRPQGGGYFAIWLLHILFAAAVVAPPFLVKEILDKGVGRGDLRRVVVLAVIMFGVYVVIAVAAKIRSHYGHVLAQKITYHLRNDLYRHLQRLSFRFYDNIKTGELLSRIIDDLNTVQEVMYHGPENIITNGSMVVFTAVALCLLNWRLAIVCLLIMLTTGFCAFFIASRMYRGHREVRKRKASLASRAEDNLSGIRIIQSFVREGFEMDRFERENHDHYLSRLNVIRPMSSLFPVSILIIGVSLGIAVSFGGYAAIEGMMTVGALTAFVMYLQRFMWPLLSLAMISEAMTNLLAGLERFFDYMDTEPDIRDAQEAVDLGRARGAIAFRDVHFQYDETPTLHNINLSIAPGETVALVGPSGAGKTTITRLIPRFYEPQQGELQVDDIDVRQIKLASLRANIGMVMQDDYLFSDTLFNNIAYGRPDASREEVLEAARKGNVDQFAESLENGYDTEVGQRGTKVSEGQAQRISIARAILKDAPIFILDEATSSVDSKTEKLIQEALERLMRDRTCIVIAHRLSTIRSAHRILFVDDGRIIEQGTHEELIDRNGRYAEFHRMQFEEPGVVIAP